MYILTRCKIGKTDAVEDYRGFLPISNTIYNQPLTGLYKTEYDTYVGSPVLSADNLLDDTITSTALVEQLELGVDGYIVTTPKKLMMFKLRQLPGKHKNCTLTAVSTPEGEMLVD